MEKQSFMAQVRTRYLTGARQAGLIFRQLEFFVLASSALSLFFIPLVNLPFSWMETFFHEMSHGLMALITGGSIQQVILHMDGSGECLTEGGWQFAVVWAGYAGAVFWGGLIYLSATLFRKHPAKILLLMLLIFLLNIQLLWIRDGTSLIIMLTISAIFLAAYYFGGTFIIRYFMQFTGLYILLGAARSPLALVDGEDEGDGFILEGLTAVPELVWVGVWELLALLAVFYLYRLSVR